MTDTRAARPRFRIMLIVDAAINLILGILLMAFPEQLVSRLGLPMTYELFYPSVLGAILIAIALALLIECVRTPVVLGGLGLGGAIAVNVCGACVIMLWLVSGRLIIPLSGYFVLWFLVFVLLAVSGLELILCESSFEKGRESTQKSGIGITQDGEANREDN